MADKFRKLKSVVETTITTATHTEVIVETGISDQAMVRNIHLHAEDPNYQVNTKLTVHGVAVYSGKGSVLLGGDQNIDVSSNMTLELDTGDDIAEYGKMNAMISFNGKLHKIDRPVMQQYDQSKNDELEFETVDLDKNMSNSDANSAFTVEKNGEVYFCHSVNALLYIYDKHGVLKWTHNWPTQIRHAATDGEFYYGRGTTGTIIYRINVSDGVPASDLPTDSISTPVNSNDGFFDIYDGHIYTRPRGNTASIYKIRLTDGEVVEILSSATDSEHIGGLIVVNDAGIPLIVEVQDNNYAITRLDTFEHVRREASAINGPTTTTSVTMMLHVAAGMVLVVNGTYNSYAIIDTNHPIGEEVMTKNLRCDNLNALNTDSLYASERIFYNPAVPRAIKYSLLVDGVKTTGVMTDA
jgi:hypothetical protein